MSYLSMIHLYIFFNSFKFQLKGGKTAATLARPLWHWIQIAPFLLQMDTLDGEAGGTPCQTSCLQWEDGTGWSLRTSELQTLHDSDAPLGPLRHTGEFTGNCSASREEQDYEGFGKSHEEWTMISWHWEVGRRNKLRFFFVFLFSLPSSLTRSFMDVPGRSDIMLLIHRSPSASVMPNNFCLCFSFMWNSHSGELL